MMLALGIEPLEPVRAKEIALRLDQVCGAAFAPIGVKIPQRARQRRNRQTVDHRLRHNPPQPARHIRAIVASGRFQPNSVDAAAITANPCA